ncbi:uncharacterized protein LOC129337249 [Eublepharis macularius]|uniref:Uncharacterized protein LOC129337249 n=1 Tax=Eublepharis macularius TaxID=481883 RepID=A0AA97K0L3_EUBMA|nr:uncharacterized protein LOC129337249 [Eublepharis macularius]XP_054846787.1 uncharacterized protein LOC129337249 [Eublepharis macularius]
MTTQSEDSKPEPEKWEKPGAKIYYCELCKVPCMSAMTLQTHFAGLRHKKTERSMKKKCAPVIPEEPQRGRRTISKHIRCLKDYIKDPNRDEPLIGLEYVVEIRFEGRRFPCYECKLCQFNTEMVPMIEHLTGQRHRKAYLVKHYPDRGMRKPNEDKEDKAIFLRRVAREVEKEEGLKMYKREGYERPSIRSSAAAKNRARWPGSTYKPENDPVLRQKALEYMEFFEITSDTEATQVVRIAQSLSDALKAFCAKKEAIKHIRSLPPLLAPIPRHSKQQTPYENFKEDPGDKKWTQEYMSNGLAQLQNLLGQAPSSSHMYQMGERTSSCTISSSDLATVSALRKSFASESASSACGLNEWMKQFSQSAPAYSQSNPVRENTRPFTSSQSSSYTSRYNPGSSTQKHDKQRADTGPKNWDSMRDSHSATRRHPANCPSQDFPSWYKDGKSNQMPVSLPAESNSPGWPQLSGYQQSNLQADRGPCQAPFSSGSSYSSYQQQNIQLNNMMYQSPAGLSSNIISQLRGKDPVTLTRMLQELIPHYPDLQKVDIYALAQALSKLN